jgi:hypothetical protein
MVTNLKHKTFDKCYFVILIKNKYHKERHKQIKLRVNIK